MEDKLKRECRKCLEKYFKKNDTLGSGSITTKAMTDIMCGIVQNFDGQDELQLVMAQYTKSQKYTTLDPQTKKMEVKYLDDAIDFPSALAIAVHFLKKVERRQSDAFSGRGLIRFSDLPESDALQVKRQSDGKRRLY